MLAVFAAGAVLGAVLAAGSISIYEATRRPMISSESGWGKIVSESLAPSPRSLLPSELRAEIEQSRMDKERASLDEHIRNVIP